MNPACSAYPAPAPTCAICSPAKKATRARRKPWRCFATRRRKWIGAFAAALGGLDTLVFTAGIGENAPLIRQRICDGLGFFGIELDPARNGKNAPLISHDAGRVTVRVIRTDEELMIARSVLRFCADCFT